MNDFNSSSPGFAPPPFVHPIFGAPRDNDVLPAPDCFVEPLGGFVACETGAGFIPEVVFQPLVSDVPYGWEPNHRSDPSFGLESIDVGMEESSAIGFGASYDSHPSDPSLITKSASLEVLLDYGEAGGTAVEVAPLRGATSMFPPLVDSCLNDSKVPPGFEGSASAWVDHRADTSFARTPSRIKGKASRARAPPPDNFLYRNDSTSSFESFSTIVTPSSGKMRTPPRKRTSPMSSSGSRSPKTKEERARIPRQVEKALEAGQDLVVVYDSDGDRDLVPRSDPRYVNASPEKKRKSTNVLSAIKYRKRKQDETVCWEARALLAEAKLKVAENFIAERSLDYTWLELQTLVAC